MDDTICNECRLNAIGDGAEWYYWIQQKIESLINKKIFHYNFLNFRDNRNGFEKMELSNTCVCMEHRYRIFAKLIEKGFQNHGPTSRFRQIDYTSNSDHFKRKNHDPEKTYQMKNGEWVEIEIEKDIDLDLEVTYED